MKKLNSTKITVIIMLVINVMIYGLYGAMFVMTRNMSRNVNEMSIKIREEIEKKEVVLGMESSLKKSKEDIDSIYDFIIKADEEINFIKEIEMIADSLDLKFEIKSVELEEVKNSETVERMNFTIDAIGKWADIYNFLRRIEHLPFKIQLNQTIIERFSEDVVSGRNVTLWLGQFKFSIVKLK